MKTWGSMLLAVSFLVLGLATPKPAPAMINMGGGWWCQFRTTWNAVTGDLTGTYYNCFYLDYWGGGGSGGTDDGGSYGGGHGSGGGSPQPLGVPFSSLSQSNISDKLKCALSKYTKSNARPKGPIKNVNGYAYAKGSDESQEYIYTKAWVDPSTLGPGWNPVGGITDLTTSPRSSYIFNYAYKPKLYDGAVFSHIPKGGEGPPYSWKWIHTKSEFNSFEFSLFVAAHEAAHQNGATILYKADVAESWANWYGYAAVVAYRTDAGAKCH